MDETLAVVLVVSNWLTFPIGIFSNSALIWLCLKVKDNEIRRSRWIIVSTATIELCECVTLVVLHLGLYHNGNISSMLIMGIVSNMPVVIAVILYASFVLIFIFRMLQLPLGFMYRYATICGKQSLLNYFTKRYLAVYIAATLVMALLQDILSVTALDFRKKRINSRSSLIYEVVEMNMKLDSSWKYMVLSLTFTVCCCLSYGIVIYTSRNLYRWLKNNAIATKTKILQRQLTTVMVTQAILPLIFTCVPAIIFVAVFLAHLPIGIYGSLPCSLINWQPGTHALISLWFVRPFRKRLINRIKGISSGTAPTALPTVFTRNNNVTVRQLNQYE